MPVEPHPTNSAVVHIIAILLLFIVSNFCANLDKKF